MGTDVFISYSRKDTVIANKICAAFDKAGITYFIDRKAMNGGMEITDVLAQAILDAKVFLFLGSRHSYSSKFTNSEIMWAFNKKEKNHILPYLIDDTEMPNGIQFAFVGINIRNISEHPIETTLVDDVLAIINKRRTEPSVVEEKVYEVDDVDVSPMFGQGRSDSFYVWLRKKLELVSSTMSYHRPRFYCIVNFVVERDGTVSNVRINDDEDQQLNARISDVILQSPRWTPGMKGGRPVAVKVVTAAKMEFSPSRPISSGTNKETVLSGPQHIYSVGEIVEVEGTKGMIFKVSGYMAIVVSLDEVQLPIKNFGSSHFTAVDCALNQKDTNQSIESGLHFFYYASNGPAVVEFNGTRYGCVHSLQGDIYQIIAVNETVVVEHIYDAWDKMFSTTGTMMIKFSMILPFHYSGYVYDVETGAVRKVFSFEISGVL